VFLLDEATLRFYRENAQSYAEWAKAPSARLKSFLALLPQGGAILELGCGAGNHSAEILAAGFKLRATDGSPEMAEIASRRLGHPVETLLFNELDEHDAYHGVWASACLLHVPREDLAAILRRIRRALKPEGLFYASFKVGEGDGRDNLGRYYNYPSPEWLQATYAAAGAWSSISSDTSEIRSFDETPATMLHLVVRKPGSEIRVLKRARRVTIP
jgi:SAM-dependent methyltransferase